LSLHNTAMSSSAKKDQWPYPGARWWKFDFHTHTPASKDTYWAKNAVDLSPETWLLKYMAAEIDCVAVTDHNSGEWVDKLKAEYQRMAQLAQAGAPPAGFRVLYLFPGVEISVAGGLHLLAIFDPEKSTSTITSLLWAVGFPEHLHGETDCRVEAACSRKTLVEVIEEIHRCGGIAIPAHSDRPKGLLETKGGAGQGAVHTDQIRSVFKAGVLAIETVNCQASKPNIYREANIQWAEVRGSDSHNLQGNRSPGSSFTWLKMESPSLAGLRLALLDGQDVSVRRSDDTEPFFPFKTPDHFIETIEIADARRMGGQGEPAKFCFTPSFNALVGGRGTGKSTVVHALRLAYRKERELDPKKEAGETFARFTKVLQNRNDPGEGGVLPTTKITLTLRRNGVLYELSWPKEGQGAVVREWDETTSDWKESANQTVSGSRFQVRLFSQGQIAELAGESQQALLKVIDEAAQTGVAQQALDEAKRTFFATRAKQREVNGKLKGRDALNLGLQDVQRKLDRFEGTHHAEVLKAYQRTSRQTREMTRQFDAAAAMADQLHQAAQDLLAEDLPDALFDSAVDVGALSVAQQLAQTIAQTKAQVEAAAQLLTQTGTSLRAQLAQSDWQARVAQSVQAYQALKADLLTQGVSDPSEYGRLVQERQRLETEIKRLDALQKQFDELKQQFMTQRENVWKARRKVSEVRSTFLQQSVADNPFVRMTLIPYGRDARVMARSLRDVLGAPDQFENDIYVEAQGDVSAKGLIADVLTAANLLDNPDEPDAPQFEKCIKQLQERLFNASRGKGGFGAWFNKHLTNAAEKRPEFIDHILCWFPEDGLKVEYSRKGNGQNFEPIGQASQGQRAAAMLAFLLAHGKEPLVLDQPEDDLDNHLIYDLVVRQIRANKQHRQLIIVTHNPNIVVNGDAEMIYALDFNSQCFISQSGSLQNQKMRDEVCSVMEGGEDAFERRYQRLGKTV